ncbi:DUF397 domain-containing protein [Streptomyces sp. NPDC047525]|uniref:DUF397 domain-containing protein n=1 Tax=Streptomyces sp. NPDC047525 TaxID=3155264 RepID=UPI0033EC98CF
MNHRTVPATSLGDSGWVKPWSGANGGNCVEAKALKDGSVALRQSTDPAGPAFISGPEAFAEFIRAIKEGEADYLLEPPGAGAGTHSLTTTS